MAACLLACLLAFILLRLLEYVHMVRNHSLSSLQSQSKMLPTASCSFKCESRPLAIFFSVPHQTFPPPFYSVWPPHFRFFQQASTRAQGEIVVAIHKFFKKCSQTIFVKMRINPPLWEHVCFYSPFSPLFLEFCR